MTVAVALPTLRISEAEAEAVGALRARLQAVRPHNKIRSDIYRGKRSAEDLGISAPPGLPQLINARIGWGAKVIDEVEHRLNFIGWTGDDDLGLNRTFRDNHLAVESRRVHLDALVYGCGFVTVGRGDIKAGQPEVLVTVESTESCTVEWDYVLRRAKSALSQTRDERGVVVLETLYLPDESIRFERVRGQLVVIDRDRHRLNRVPVARLLNRDSASDLGGQSEITPSIIYHVDAATRTLVSLEINREFYTTPKWTALNTDPEVFGMGEDRTDEENRRAGWKSNAGRMNVIPPQADENGDPIEPKLHEFRPAPPTPYIDQMRMHAQILASETGIPAPYFGFVTDNPNSADSIRQQEHPLVMRVQRKQDSFGLAWKEVAYLALLMRDGAVDPDKFDAVEPNWADAATPTRSASADAAAKLIGAGVLPPDSRVTWSRIGLSMQEQRQLESDRRRSDGMGALTALMQRFRDEQGDESE